MISTGSFLQSTSSRVYESVVLEDYSLSEVAEELGISRQGVHDMIRRCNHTLEEYEKKLHLVEKFLCIKEAGIRESASIAERVSGPGDYRNFQRDIRGVIEHGI